ncbi:MFS transporter [Candidatus Bathyarchaeota archaeon]|nr:MFS transporter [Candidatus Bathyarchaeota archaeon]
MRINLTKIYSKIGRNAKVLIATEPLWSIPMNWVFFYRSIFLSVVIGLSSVEIGLLITVFNIFSSIMPLFGGYLADRFGRKRVFMLFDSVCWLSSLALWMISRNIWHALLAYIVESTTSLIYSVWECMLVEDTKLKFRSLIYGSISAIYRLGSLTMPVAGIILGFYGPDLGCRIIFALAFCAMIPMFIIRQIYLREPEIGQIVRRDKIFSGFKGYLSSLSLIKKDRIILALILILIMIGFYNSSYAYFPLYLVNENGLGLSEEAASFIPSASSAVSLLLFLLIIPKLRSKSSYIKALILGYSLGSLAIFILIILPPGSIFLALPPAFLLGFYYAIAFSVSRTFLMNQIDYVDSRARAKIMSIAVTLSSLINLPTPTITGYLFSLNPKLPFIAILATFFTCLLILIISSRK